jgi:hypothetical protein
VNAPSAFYLETGRAIAARVTSEHGVVAKLLWSDLRDRPIDELPPYGAILRSYQFFFNRSAADYDPARQALLQAVRQRPECVLAWAQLGRLSIANHCFEIVPAATPIDEAIAQVQSAVHLDPACQRARAVLASAFVIKGGPGAVDGGPARPGGAAQRVRESGRDGHGRLRIRLRER